MQITTILSILKDLFYYLAYFLLWWYIKQTAFWVKFIGRTVLLLTDGTSLIPMVTNLFAPYHQDYTFVGRLMGFIIRFVWVVFSLIILSVVGVLLIFILPIWWILPLSFYFGLSFMSFLDHWAYSLIGIVVSLFCVYVYWKNYINKPKKTVWEIEENELTIEALSETFTSNLKHVFNHAYDSVKSDREEEFSYQLFTALIIEKRTAPIFWRLNVNPKAILERAVANRNEIIKTIDPVPQLLKMFWAKAREMGHYHIDTDAVLIALVEDEEPIQKIFTDLDIKKEDIHRTAQWIYARIKAAHSWKYWQKREFHLYGGADRAMTSGWIPTLKHYAENITLMVSRGAVPYTVGRKKEIDEVVRILSRTTKNNVMLLGPAGVGKTSIVYGIAQRILTGDIPELKNKRVMSLDLAALMGGTTGRGDFEERLSQVIREISSGNTVIFIDEMQSLMGAGAGDGSLLDASSILEPYLSNGSIQCIGATTHRDFREHVEPKETFANHFQKVEVAEPTDEEAIYILEGLAGMIEARQQVTIVFQAIEQSVRLSRQFIRDRVLPEKAIDILDEAAVVAKKAKDRKVTGELIAELIAQKTGIPVSKMTVTESEKLLNLEAEMHKRMVDQEEAIGAIANAMRRARAGLKDAKKPIATFLFLGPTGVGKTESAKTLAELYFGSEDSMVRLDMSEFQDPSATSRLIGAPPGQVGFGSGGQLTNAVRSKPFSLVLLDEFEKANQEILNLFLQVFDDGRLTDSMGRTVMFYDSIIIATSNAQSVAIQDAVKSGVDAKQLHEIVMQDLNKHFKPELINRFDGIVIFKPLGMDEVIQITHMMLKKISQKLQEQEIGFEITPAAVYKLARLGFDPQFGARPLRRVLQEKLENPLAQKLLKQEIKRGGIVQINENDIAD